MQIIYGKAVGKYHFNEKDFFLEPGECALFVMEQEDVIKAMKKRSTYSTRACLQKIVIVLVKSCAVYDTIYVEEKFNLEEYLVDHDVIYEVKEVSLIDFVQCGFIDHDQLIYAYFKDGS